jgi:dihydrofolate reductase
MRKLIAAINMTLDGFCDHTAINADEEIHEHYSELLRNADTILYGRVTFQLMQYWQTILKNPTGNKAMDKFAITIDKIPKVVFSNTLKSTEWETARLAKKDLKEEILTLKQQPGKDILVGSPGLIVSAMNLNLIDEYQLCIHPVVTGTGLPLFNNINQKTFFNLLGTKNFKGGAVIHYYVPVKNT